MVTKKLSDNVAELAMERTAALLADRVADRVVKVLMDANFDRRFADALLKAIQKQLAEME
ncbi:hypothetical protein ES705_21924 [subsurface metagenome]